MFDRRSGGRRAGAPATGTVGARGEAQALAHLQGHGLELVARNYRVARGPSRRGGEVDLVMRDRREGTLVFVEVRARAAGGLHGGAAASVTPAKRQRIVYAARHFLLRYPAPPRCRFDVVAIDGDTLRWLPGAFDAG